jgi:hypothetical protein
MAKTRSVHFPPPKTDAASNDAATVSPRNNSQHLSRPPEVNGGFRPADRWLGLTAQAIEATLYAESLANLQIELEPPRTTAAAEAYNGIARDHDPDFGKEVVIDIYD